MNLIPYNEYHYEAPRWCYEWLKELYGFNYFVNVRQEPNIADHVRRAYKKSQEGLIVVVLLPSRTETAWFHEYCSMADEILFLRGRLDANFGGEIIGKAGFPHIVVVFDGRIDKIDNIPCRMRMVNTKPIRERYENRYKV